MHEVGHPPLVLGAVLVGAVDAALAEHDRVHAEAARVVAHVLVGRAFAAAVRAVEVDRLGLFTGTVVVVELSIHLIRRCKDERRVVVVRADRLQHVERAARVDVEVRVGVEQRGGHRHLAGKMEDGVLVLHVPRKGARVPHVLFNECDPVGVLGDEPLQVALGARTAQVVEQADVPAVLDQVDRGVDAQEAGAACDEDPAFGVTRKRWRRLGLGQPLRGVHCRAYVSRWICPSGRRSRRSKRHRPGQGPRAESRLDGRRHKRPEETTSRTLHRPCARSRRGDRRPRSGPTDRAVPAPA